MLTVLYCIAGVLGLAALAAAGWALLADRSRGRRRCPKCFHAMDPAIGLVCPECGKDARQERRLFRTRRRWKLAAAAVVLLGGAAVAAFGLARVRQAGGVRPALPNWAAVRLMWVGDKELDSIVVSRVLRGEMSRGSAQVIINEAARRLETGRTPERASAMMILDLLAQNGLASWPDDVQGRPMLSELNTARLTTALLALEQARPGSQTDVAEVLEYLKDVDDRALVRMCEMLAEPPGSTEPQPGLRLGHRLRGGSPGAPEILTLPLWAVREPGLIPVDFGNEITRFDGDTDAMRAWAKSRWERKAADQDVADRLPELWLWCRLARYSPDLLPTVLEAARSDDLIVKRYAVSLLGGFKWSDQVEAALCEALRDKDRETGTAAILTAVGYGVRAKTLTRELLELAASTDGVPGNGSFVEHFERVGGDLSALRAAIVLRLDMLYEHHRDDILLDMRPRNPGQFYDTELPFKWLADIGGSDAEGRAVCEAYMTLGRIQPSLDAAVAYAALGGDRKRATRLILDKDPDFSSGRFRDGTAEQCFLDLLRRGLGDSAMVVAHIPLTSQGGTCLFPSWCAMCTIGARRSLISHFSKRSPQRGWIRACGLMRHP
jgi:hypothetical protein